MNPPEGQQGWVFDKFSFKSMNQKSEYVQNITAVTSAQAELPLMR